MKVNAPSVDDVRNLQHRLRQWLILTPTMRCVALEDHLGGNLQIHGKLEFLQETGTFKPRGALAVVSQLTPDQLARGITAVSAGNHAIATAYAAKALNTSAKVVMTRTASPARMAACRSYGAEIVLADDVHIAFDIVEQIRHTEGRYFVHPFEGPDVATGTATVGLEICDQVGSFDVAIIPVGGGGLCAGISSVIRQINPDCELVGVEPTGANSMQRSFSSGKPEGIEKVMTIADSLGAPFALPYSFELCRQNLDDLVMINDEQLKSAMRFLFSQMKMAVEPACAATTAALCGPLHGRFAGRKVVIVFCGSNIDWATFQRHAEVTNC